MLLIPSCVGLTMSIWKLGVQLTGGPQSLATPLWLSFCIGYVVWLAVFAFLPQPMRTYVLGHELTHAFWAVLMGARVSKLKVGKNGGSVQTNKTNWVIMLAPYFFPFYAMVFIALFYLLNVFWPLRSYMALLFFFVGLGWSFHVTFTLMMLFNTRQPDIQSQGTLFSLAIIYCMNILVTSVTAVLLAPQLGLFAFLKTVGNNLLTAYVWTVDKTVILWHHVFSLFTPIN